MLLYEPALVLLFFVIIILMLSNLLVVPSPVAVMLNTLVYPPQHPMSSAKNLRMLFSGERKLREVVS